jgi:hypothetical protein
MVAWIQIRIQEAYKGLQRKGKNASKRQIIRNKKDKIIVKNG